MSETARIVETSSCRIPWGMTGATLVLIVRATINGVKGK